MTDLLEGILQLNVTDNAAPNTSFSGKLVGKRVDYPSRNQVVQLRGDGFSFSQLPPYETFELALGDALRVWEQYAEVLRSPLIYRLTVRFINALTLPLPIVAFQDYLISAPTIPHGLPNTLASFLTRLVMPKGEDVAIVSQVLEGQTENGDGLNVLFDIEVTHECNVVATDIEAIKAILLRLRDYKNDIFFKSLTEKALEAYR